mmetsp:Transcript_1527/g.4453  ORF Transcript_1527/g.4453 Transcript_1527/m.4453 type:complete len:215 (+) Transcript_1527:12-656(+)
MMDGLPFLPDELHHTAQNDSTCIGCGIHDSASPEDILWGLHWVCAHDSLPTQLIGACNISHDRPRGWEKDAGNIFEAFWCSHRMDGIPCDFGGAAQLFVGTRAASGQCTRSHVASPSEFNQAFQGELKFAQEMPLLAGMVFIILFLATALAFFSVRRTYHNVTRSTPLRIQCAVALSQLSEPLAARGPPAAGEISTCPHDPVRERPDSRRHLSV